MSGLAECYLPSAKFSSVIAFPPLSPPRHTALSAPGQRDPRESPLKPASLRPVAIAQAIEVSGRQPTPAAARRTVSHPPLLAYLRKISYIGAGYRLCSSKSP